MEVILPKINTKIPKKKFEGTPWNNLVAMDYLNKRFDNHCVIIPDKKIPNDHSDISIRWIQTKGKHGYLSVPRNFWKEFRRHLSHSHNKRFIAFPFGFTCLKNGGHANYLIYDLKTKTLERFDSIDKNGKTTLCLRSTEIDDKIKKAFDDEMGDDFVIKYLKPFTKYKIFQEIQDNEKEKRLDTDPAYGFCSAWACFWVETRCLNPDVPRDKLIELTLNKLYKNNISLTHFIRNYSQNIVEHSKIVQKLLNVYLPEDKLVPKRIRTKSRRSKTRQRSRSVKRRNKTRQRSRSVKRRSKTRRRSRSVKRRSRSKTRRRRL